MNNPGEQIKDVLAANGDAHRAEGQQRYMKSEMPYRGITSGELNRLLKPIFQDWVPDRGEWEKAVRELWDTASYREERYAAIRACRTRAAQQWQDPDVLSLYQHLVTTGAWWDYVDEIAGHLVGGVLANHRDQATETIRHWAISDDLWLRRTAVLSQLRHGTTTDQALLHEVIAVNIDDESFWLRKAIGWALRQYAKSDPDWVRSEVSSFEGRISGLSRREALKHL